MNRFLGWLRTALRDPRVRLFGRALAVGVSVFAVQMWHAPAWDVQVLRSAASAGALAFVEVFTPLNIAVGWFKGNIPKAKKK